MQCESLVKRILVNLVPPQMSYSAFDDATDETEFDLEC